MAYKRPLSNTQIACIILLWVVMVGWILSRVPLDGFVVLTILMSGIIVFYPVVKSLKERKGRP
ncbi:hypothetical protein [Porphyromonas sp. COT-239 OH1446]|uniref:hypothetical protein n=1 Tax=Porphyromonas sp. COT-239 OH1446 TaxID=1515613 RepID=UPI00052C9929|nr:hypothetical protein [Porphyromonas sp. COT-239 OH1446]KGN70285.1 hypothetical protein HQ37_04410 [Porphyromonas sp. COT-239 OH1446]